MVVKLMVSAAQRAMMIQFWQVGYAQTTVDDLMTASQLSRTQFYRQYHNKRVALRQSLQYYQSTLNEQLQLLVERDQARQMPLPALIADWLLFPFKSEEWPAGCLLVNLLAEADSQSVLAGQLQTMYADLQTQLVSLLTSQARELAAPVGEVAASLMQVRSGIQLLAKQRVNAAQLKRQAQVSVKLIMKES